MKKISIGFLFALCILCSPKDAFARRGIAIINTGEDVTHVSDLKPEMKESVEAGTAPGVKVGIIYSRFGVFWLDIWRWNKKFVLYTDNEVWEFPKEELAEISEGPLKGPFTMTVPPGLIVLGVLGIGFIGLMIFGSDEEDEESSAAHGGGAPHADDEA